MSLKTLSDLANSLEKRAAELDEQVSRVAVKAAEKIIFDLAYITPVDTSRALSNWRASLANPLHNAIPPFFMGKKGSTQGASALATVDDARNVLKKKKPGVTIYITNNLDYIRPLNEGLLSRQTPAGFVERAVMLGRDVVKKEKVRF